MNDEIKFENIDHKTVRFFLFLHKIEEQIGQDKLKSLIIEMAQIYLLGEPYYSEFAEEIFRKYNISDIEI